MKMLLQLSARAFTGGCKCFGAQDNECEAPKGLGKRVIHEMLGEGSPMLASMTNSICPSCDPSISTRIKLDDLNSAASHLRSENHCGDVIALRLSEACRPRMRTFHSGLREGGQFGHVHRKITLTKRFGTLSVFAKAQTVQKSSVPQEKENLQEPTAKLELKENESNGTDNLQVFEVDAVLAKELHDNGRPLGGLYRKRPNK